MIQGMDIYLKGLEEEDLVDRHRWLNDREITEYFTNSGLIPLCHDKLLQWYRRSIEKNEEIHFSVFLSDHTHIGGTQLKSIDWRNRSAEFGIFIGEKTLWGKGLGAQITRLIINYSFKSLNLHRIWLRVDLGNVAAIRCYEKAGFTREGVFRQDVFRDGSYHDTLVMGLLREEWECPL